MVASIRNRLDWIVTSTGQNQSVSHAVFPAIITGALPKDGDDPANDFYVFPRRYTWEAVYPGTTHAVPTIKNVVDLDTGLCYLGEDEDYGKAYNTQEFGRDALLRYNTILPNTPVIMFVVERPPVIYAPTNNCSGLPLPQFGPAVPWLYYFSQWVDPLVSVCDEEENP